MRQHTILALVALASLPANLRATVIYDARLASPGSIWIISDPGETSSSSETGTGEVESRVGDQITFAGTDRFVTSFSTRLQGFVGGASGPVTLGVELSIYQASAGLPGALLWSGLSSPVLLSNTTTPVEVAFAPNMTLPDTVCFAIAFPTISAAPGVSRTYGVISANNPAIGSSPVTTIHQQSSDGTWFIEDESTQFGGIFNGVDAHVVAVPAPQSAILLAIGGSLAAGRRRRVLN